MVRIGITGHIRLRPSSHLAIYRALVGVLRTYPLVHGVTCAAEGSDRIFAQAVRDCAGTYEVILPQPPDRPGRADSALQSLLSHASRVRRMRTARSPEESYAAASRLLLRRSDILVAVWDGTATGGPGGTADTVAKARAAGKTVLVVWPEGAERDTGAAVVNPAR